MFVELVKAWTHQIGIWIVAVYQYIFPEYPEIGVAIIILAAGLALYYLLRKQPRLAGRMAFTVLIMLTFVAFAIHSIIKIFRIVV